MDAVDVEEEEDNDVRDWLNLETDSLSKGRMYALGTYPCFPTTFLTRHQSSSSPLTISTTSPALRATSSSNSVSNFHRDMYSDAGSTTRSVTTIGMEVDAEDFFAATEEAEAAGAAGGVYGNPRALHISRTTCSRVVPGTGREMVDENKEYDERERERKGNEMENAHI